jgi:hypothetical protein
MRGRRPRIERVLGEGGRERAPDEACSAEHSDFHPAASVISRRK